MAEAKTKPTAASVQQHLDAIEDAQRRADCQAIAQIMHKVTRQDAVMWGSGIVGFGRYSYIYASGHGGESCLTGFAARKSDISVYLVAGGADQAALLSRLGKHKMGKACLYIRKLADIDVQVLALLVADSVAEVKRRHPALPTSSST
jgi:hypothetical protein